MKSFASISLGLLALLEVSNAAPAMHNARLRRFDRFNLFARYVAASSMANNCPSTPNGAEILSTISEPSTDTQASIFLDHKRREVVLAMPGSLSAMDYAIDGNTTQVPYSLCDGCAVHGGFLWAWQSIEGQATPVIQNAINNHKGYKVVTTGYSLGAAVAGLAWAGLKQKGLPVHAAYTFGQPRLGNVAFADWVDRVSGADDNNTGHYFRIAHAGDPVPNWPAQFDGGQTWRHMRTQFWEAGKTVQSDLTTWRCYGQESLLCSLSMEGQWDGNDHLQYSNVQFTAPAQYCGL